ncbi:MAG: alpha/beta hydrolase, partial [Rhodospirillaceae bacterium]|nr:alpha/beta hydrolase [Rhodospirillaceae bacterium]
PPYAQKAIRARDRNRPDVVAKLALPVLVSRGTEDWIISGEETARLVQALPNAVQSVYDATGHMPFVHHPERFNTELAAFARMHWSQAGRPQ